MPKPLETEKVAEEPVETPLVPVQEEEVGENPEKKAVSSPAELASWEWKLMLSYMKRAKSGEFC